MERAVVTDDGMVAWSEMCLCPSPLQHERATVLDRHFTDIVTEPIDAHATYPGRPFLAYLRDIVGLEPGAKGG